jgi:CheY-like chemotaxis protein
VPPEFGAVSVAPSLLDHFMTVLLADRDEYTRRTLSAALRHCGMTTLEAAEPDLAHDLMQRHAIDVVVLDYPMRLSSGVTLTRAIREEARVANIPIINLTSYVTGDSADDAKADGVTQTIGKPADIRAVIDVIRAFVHARGSQRSKAGHQI